MSNTNTDYSNTIIYKITCKDTTITDVYVGHTVNFVQRKHAHKQGCINTKTVNYKCKLYEVIRNNGGWDNWTMEIVNFFNCSNQFEARQKEQEYYISLNATLNSVEPFPMPTCEINNAFRCDICNITNTNKTTHDIHINTAKHKKKLSNIEIANNQLFDIENKKTKVFKFRCNNCSFSTNNKQDYSRHYLTEKHKQNIILTTSATTIHNNTKTYICPQCDKVYMSRVGLWGHKKVCNKQPVIENTFTHVSDVPIMPTFDNNIVFKLVKQNQEFNELLTMQNAKIMEQNQTIIEQNKNIIELVKQISSLTSVIL